MGTRKAHGRSKLYWVIRLMGWLFLRSGAFGGPAPARHTAYCNTERPSNHEEREGERESVVIVIVVG